MEAIDWRQLGAVKRERAAEILGDISPHTVDAMLHSGQLRSLRAGRRVLITVHSLRAALGEAAALSAPAPVPVAPPPAPPRPALSPVGQRILREARRRLGG
jgi:hypothetical protein